MNDISAKISLYHNLFLVCLILALVCLVAALILFFVLDIRSTLGYLTGRRAKKKIKELEEATALSGRLMPKERTNMQYVAQEMKDDMGVRQKARPGIRKVEHAVEAATPITAEMPAASNYSNMPEEQGTALLQEEGTALLQEAGTEVLKDNFVGQEADNVSADGSTGVLESGQIAMGKFVIVRELMMIHTEEVI